MSIKDKYKNKNILITGGLGFIGSTLAYKLIEYGSKVTVIDSLMPDYGGNMFNIDGISNNITIEVSDVRNKDVMNRLICGKDYIFNLAGTLSHIDSMTDPFTDLEINCVAQLSILEALKNNNPDAKILFAGTRGQYGKAEKLPVTEEHLMKPTDVNGINNMAGEWYHILYNNVYGIKAVSLRLSNTYGPRHQMKHHKQGIINFFIRQLIEGKKIRVFGDGKQIRDTNYVDDVVEAMLLAMVSDKTNGQVYNIGGYPYSLLEIVENMIDVHGRGEYEIIPFPEASKKIEIGDYIADYSKIKNAIGWKPNIDISEGLKKTFDYYLKNRNKYW